MTILYLRVVKAMMSAKGFIEKQSKAVPTKEERKQLKAQGVNMRDRKAVLAATVELREKNKPAEEPAKPTEAELLTSILEELQKQNASK